MLSRYVFGAGRRRDFRRGGESHASFVDTHGAGLFAVITAIAMLNILDALFTVLFLSCGGREVNPVVQFTLDSGLWVFVVFKSLGIGACLLVLTLTKNFRFSRFGLGVIFFGYLTLLGWHAFLYTQIPEYLV